MMVTSFDIQAKDQFQQQTLRVNNNGNQNNRVINELELEDFPDSNYGTANSKNDQ